MKKIDRQSPLIIAIAAVSSGGKTTITSHLSERLTNAKALYFDDYDLEQPDDIIDWVERGADSNEFIIHPILADIAKLSNSNEVSYIVLDYPFARTHNQLTSIDLTVFIDTPLDIALAWRILRDYEEATQESLWDELRVYLSRVRLGFESMLRTIKPNSDLVIDGTLSIEEIVQRIEQEIASRNQQ
jgi:uridine kinase